jgi:hypothetical protein
MDNVKVPIPDPLLVFVDSEVVGFCDVDQIIPLCVTAPPSETTVPPNVALVVVIDVGGDVVMTGSDDVVNGIVVAPYRFDLIANLGYLPNPFKKFIAPFK